MDQVKEHIKKAKKFFKNYIKQKEEDPDIQLKIVIGNIAGDLDSIVGSILLSLILTRNPCYPSEYKEDEEKEEDKECIVIPCMNFPREELEYKLEILHHLEKYKINKKKLIFIEGNIM